MDTFFYIILFVIGTIFGSFASVVIYRIKSWEKGIFMWRSHCSNCDKKLSSTDLIPVIWYMLTKWKCNACKKKISLIYPILEISMWVLFALVWYFLIDFWLILEWNWVEIIKLLFWLFIWFVTIVYTFYDILFLEIPESVLALWIIGTLWILWLQSLFPGFNMIEWLPAWWNTITMSLLAVAWSISVVWILYVIMLKELSVITDIILLASSILGLILIKYAFDIELTNLAITNGLMWMLGIFLFFFLQIIVSKWAWMWWGDLRIAILIGLILGTTLSFPAMMLTYLIGSFIWIGFIIYSRIWKWETTMTTQIPFWPFLAAWFFVTIFFQQSILKFMSFYL